jgi:hypothetical protein
VKKIVVVSKKYGKQIIIVDGKILQLGRFRSETEAARIYNEMAIKHFGEFAKINIIK